MPIADRKDPYLAFNFAVEIDDLVVGGFNEVSGLQAETEIQEYREGGVNEYVHKRAGPTRYPTNLVLRKGISDTKALWSWYCNVIQGKVERKTVSVLLMDAAGDEKRRWSFQSAYPVKWVGPDLRAASSEVAAEIVEIAHEGLAHPIEP
jgi:phage tail-like protein